MMYGSRLPGRWSDWAVVVHDMPQLEVIVHHARLMILAPHIATTEAAAVAHALAHLELGHHEAIGSITDTMERWALQLAYLLGDETYWVA